MIVSLEVHAYRTLSCTSGVIALLFIFFNPLVSVTVMFAQETYTVSEGSVQAVIVVQSIGMLDSSFTVNVIGPTGTTVRGRTPYFAFVLVDIVVGKRSPSRCEANCDPISVLLNFCGLSNFCGFHGSDFPTSESNSPENYVWHITCA